MNLVKTQSMFTILKRSFWWILASLLVLLSSYFAINNFQLVNVDLIYQQVDLPLVFIMLTAFIFGVIAAWLINAWVFIKQINTIRQLQKDIADYRQELSQLRKSPLSGP